MALGIIPADAKFGQFISENGRSKVHDEAFIPSLAQHKETLYDSTLGPNSQDFTFGLLVVCVCVWCCHSLVFYCLV